MININIPIVEKLNTVLPTHYELYLDSHISVPCITYQIITNTEVEKGNINGYSNISVRIKLWAVTVEDLCGYSVQVDNAIAELGPFNRASVAELTDGDLL